MMLFVCVLFLSQIASQTLHLVASSTFKSQLLKFGNVTGTPVRYTRDSANGIDLILDSFNKQLGDIDVVGLDLPWVPQVAEHVLDLNTIIPKSLLDETIDYMKSPYQHKSKLVGFPGFSLQSFMFYRKDLLQKYNFTLPKTWAELEETAMAIALKEQTLHGQLDISPYLVDLDQNLFEHTLEILDAYKVETLVDANGQITMLDPAKKKLATQAFKHIQSWVGTIIPPRALERVSASATNSWLAGNGVFYRAGQWMGWLSQGTDSKIKDKVGVMNLPSLTGEFHGRGILYGWGGLAISKYSKSPEKAKDLLLSLVSQEAQLERILRGDLRTPTLSSLQDHPVYCSGKPGFCNLDLSSFLRQEVSGIPAELLSEYRLSMLMIMSKMLRKELTPEEVAMEISCVLQLLLYPNKPVPASCPSRWISAAFLGCGANAVPDGDLCVCVEGDLVKSLTHLTTRDCIQRSASNDEQRVFWTISLSLNIIGVLCSSNSLFHFYSSPLLTSVAIRSQLAIYIPDFVMSTLYGLLQFVNLINGTGLRGHHQTYIAFITYVVVIATLAGPVVVACMAYFSTIRRSMMSPKILYVFIATPWAVGIVLAATSYSAGVLGTFRGLYYMFTTWDHDLSGGLMLPVFIAVTVATIFFYILIVRVVTQSAKTSKATNVVQVRVLKRGAAVVLSLFVSWSVFSIIGFLHWTGRTPPLFMDSVGALLTYLQPLFDWLLLRSMLERQKILHHQKVSSQKTSLKKITLSNEMVSTPKALCVQQEPNISNESNTTNALNTNDNNEAITKKKECVSEHKQSIHEDEHKSVRTHSHSNSPLLSPIPVRINDKVVLTPLRIV